LDEIILPSNDSAILFQIRVDSHNSRLATASDFNRLKCYELNNVQIAMVFAVDSEMQGIRQLPAHRRRPADSAVDRFRAGPP
jgi:hypothetical protein